MHQNLSLFFNIARHYQNNEYAIAVEFILRATRFEQVLSHFTLIFNSENRIESFKEAGWLSLGSMSLYIYSKEGEALCYLIFLSHNTYGMSFFYRYYPHNFPWLFILVKIRHSSVQGLSCATLFERVVDSISILPYAQQLFNKRLITSSWLNEAFRLLLWGALI